LISPAKGWMRLAPDRGKEDLRRNNSSSSFWDEDGGLLAGAADFAAPRRRGWGRNFVRGFGGGGFPSSVVPFLFGSPTQTLLVRVSRNYLA
jgi:hypothetical protein